MNSLGFDKPEQQTRVVKVMAMADKELLVPQEPSNPRNRRVTIIILLLGSYFYDPKAMPTTRSLLPVPDAKIKKIEPKKEEKPVENKVPCLLRIARIRGLLFFI